ncbi:hypothetical protein BX666DRAFT_2113500 [Dichotomocladium elegans]|nr:hypothetical protein BX666DRAFT_2113500 [Dichotomocladium elegans]
MRGKKVCYIANTIDACKVVAVFWLPVLFPPFWEIHNIRKCFEIRELLDHIVLHHSFPGGRPCTRMPSRRPRPLRMLIQIRPRGLPILSLSNIPQHVPDGGFCQHYLHDSLQG